MGIEPSTQRRYGGLALVFGQVLLTAFLLYALDLQTSAFRTCVYLAATGFVVHHFLVPRLRLPFFVLLSLLALVLVLGAPPSWERLWDPRLALPRAGAILAIAAALIGTCRLQLPFWGRVAALAAIAAVVAAFRAGWIADFGVTAVWPLAASLFMFRLIVYVYDLSTAKVDTSWTRALAYFFLLPNAANLLFPVVDFKKFCASHYNDAPLAIYQRGARWMARGVVQLIVYRYIDQLFFLQAHEVASGRDLVQFIVTSSLLYLKVSGQFHLIIGVLLLFGFNLPRPNHHYFLASSVTDYWRRVNIYWMEFMMKIVYYPTVFRLKALGPRTSMVVGTSVVFLVTWALHLYQTWWLKGSAAPTWSDSLFWGIFGLMAVANSLWEFTHGRQRRLTAPTYTARSATGLALRTAAMFACISLLWSLWMTPSIATWVAAWTYADLDTLGWGAGVLTVVALAKIVIEVLPAARKRTVESGTVRGFGLGPDFVPSIVPLLVIVVLAQPLVQAQLDGGRLQAVRDALATGDSMIDGLASADRGYYEHLTGVDESNRQLIETFTRQQIFTGIGPEPRRPVRDLRRHEMVPSWTGEAYFTHFETNRWGMRDRDYTLATPVDTVRVALLGSSQVMGFGVSQDAVFETIIENRANAAAAMTGGRHLEILNLSAVNYSPYSQIDVIRTVGAQFKPDIVVFVGHLYDLLWVGSDLPRFLDAGIDIPEYPRSILAKARVTDRTHQFIAEERLEPYRKDLVQWSYRQIADTARAAGALPLYVFLPIPNELPFNGPSAASAATLEQLAADAGFAVIDLANVFADQDPKAMTLGAAMFDHYSVAAHARIADALYAKLIAEHLIDLSPRAITGHEQDTTQSKRSEQAPDGTLSAALAR